ncbi:hypothetical protein VTH06DRAFT_2257 [Thermothelomyces fergusii]
MNKMTSERYSRPLSTEPPLPGRRDRQSSRWPFQSVVTDPDPPSPAFLSQAEEQHDHEPTTLHSFHPLRSHPVVLPLGIGSPYEEEGTKSRPDSSPGCRHHHQPQQRQKEQEQHQQEAYRNIDDDDGKDVGDNSALIPEYVRSFLLLRRTTPDPVSRTGDGGGDDCDGCGGRTGTAQRHDVQLVGPDGPASPLLHRSRVADFGEFRLGEGDGDDYDGAGVDDDVDHDGDGDGDDGKSDNRHRLRRRSEVRVRDDLDPERGEGGGLEMPDGRERAGPQEEQRFLAGDEDKGLLLTRWGSGPGADAGTGAVVVVGAPGRGWEWFFRGGGWRAGVTMNVVVMFVVLITGFVCLAVAISRASRGEGTSAIFTGDCGTARAMEWGLHAVINVFAAVMVAAANYTFQVLSSPTRDEVNAAHWNRDWFEIGIPSLRNLRHIRRRRALLAIVVLATALVTPVMYNAVVFVSSTAPEVKAVLVGESLLRGATLSDDISDNKGSKLGRTDLLVLQQRAARGELVRLSTPACFDKFSQAFDAEYSAVLLVSKSLDGMSLTQGPDASSINTLVPDRSSIQYCLAQRAPAPTCEVELDAPLLGSVALVNSIALVVAVAVLLTRPSSFRPLVTLGDAISSFLQEPDQTTQGACLLSKTDILHGRWPLTTTKCWTPQKHYWLRSVSSPLWIVTATVWALCLGLLVASLAHALGKGPSARLSPPGAASPHALLALPTATPAGAAAALVAALPQLLPAALYLTANALLTSYYLSHESSLFAAAAPAAWPRPLRVSSADPAGAQTSSLHLTLPPSVSAVLVAVLAGLSLVLSQSVFAVVVRRVEAPVSSSSSSLAGNAAATTATAPPVAALGLSGVGLVVLLAALVGLAAAVVGLGLRRAPPAGPASEKTPGNPMALPGGSCSAVISARCHPLAGEQALWTKPVVWGVVSEDGGPLGIGHCGFTAGRAGLLEAGRSYA